MEIWFGSVVSTVGRGVLGHNSVDAEDEVVEEPNEVFHFLTLRIGQGSVLHQDDQGLALLLHVLNVNGDADEATSAVLGVDADVDGGVLHGSHSSRSLGRVNR
jgi:hypothetical protein